MPDSRGREAAGLRVAVSATCGAAETDPCPARWTKPPALEEARARVACAHLPIWNVRRAHVIVCEAAFAGAAASMPAECMALLDPGSIETIYRGMMISAAVERQAELD
jgi:hypothetical protein